MSLSTLSNSTPSLHTASVANLLLSLMRTRPDGEILIIIFIMYRLPDQTQSPSRSISLPFLLPLPLRADRQRFCLPRSFLFPLHRIVLPIIPPPSVRQGSRLLIVTRPSARKDEFLLQTNPPASATISTTLFLNTHPSRSPSSPRVGPSRKTPASLHFLPSGPRNHRLRRPGTTSPSVSHLRSSSR